MKAMGLALTGVLVSMLVSMASSADLPLKAPAGWKTDQQDGAIQLTPGDVPEGGAYAVVVTPVLGKAGTLEEVYEVAKQLVAEVGTYTAATPPQQAQSDGGWDYRFTIGSVEKGGGSFLAQVMALKKGDEGGVVIVVSDSVDTMQKYSDAFANMIRSLGGSGKPPPAPTVAPGSGTVDLQYTVPAGWVETRKEGVTLVEATSDEQTFSSYRWTLLVMPSQPLQGSVRDYFKEYWRDLVSANYDSAVVPLPLLVRLGDG